MKTLQHISALLITTAFFASGCIQSESGGNLGLDSLHEVTIESTSQSANVGDSVTFTIPNANNYSSFEWKVVHESGMELTSCASTLSSMSCLFDEAGNSTISITTIDRNGNSKTGTLTVNVIDPAAPKNQPPRLVAEIKNSAGQIQKILATDSTLDDGSLSVVKGTYTLDFSKTTDDNNTINQLSFEISWDGVTYTKISKVSSLNLTQVKDYEFYIRATDLENASSSKKATATVTCNPLESSTPKLDLSTATITVNPNASGLRNFYDYSISGIKGGSGSANYQVSWDFNGDGLNDNNFSSTHNQLKIYTYHAGTRKVRASVRDTVCKYSATKTIDYNFNIFKMNTDFAKAPATRDAIMAGLDSLNDGQYYFLQASIRPVGTGLAALEANQNVEFRSYQSQTDATPPIRMFCDYNKDWVVDGDKNGSPTATLVVKARNTYYRNSPQEQSLVLTINGIKDLNGTNSASASSPADIDTSTASLTNIQYITDGGQDLATVYTYAKTKACTLTTKIIPIQGTAPCSTTGSDSDYGVRIFGVYHCPDAGSGTNHVSIGNNTGAFFCEVQKIDACVGGGGGGGGVPPKPR